MRQNVNETLEVSRLRHTVVERLVRNVNQLTPTRGAVGGEVG